MSDELWQRAMVAFQESRRLMQEAERVRGSGESLRHTLAGTLDEMRDFGTRARAWLQLEAVRPNAPLPTRHL
ncbi:hypothetical protein GCM10007886_17510 [Methylobacterium gregans]|uniref:Uncharacterized protein n=1 Tax=Methylobacterium gregans TaxID=374424 RepID=A0AA37MEE8_9HYPH|nr:hypothetical protein [Methylobacterium gregans]MDQ0523214.1 hypothetical protein [Methylobacterium gregans]GJD80624.1 hypothetical protein NBEOAGPD_3865 [Methylobacterium gregans]GLS53568.1 hypothetical protein GCM10007886_17510 [Methylobacterium gregans]